MGYDEESKGHRIYWEGKRTVTVERSVRFVPETRDVHVEAEDVPLEGEIEGERPAVPISDDDKRPTSPQPSLRATVEDIVEDDADDELVPAAEPVEESGRPTRVRKESDYVRRLRSGEGTASGRSGAGAIPRGLQLVHDVVEEAAMSALSDDWEMVAVEDFAMATVMDAAEGLNPSYEEARMREDWPKWQEAIKAELDSLKANGTWSLVERPTEANVVDCKWVLRIKKNAAGEIEKYKARLVARGFTQIHGVDFYETYAPVARLSSFRLLIALANRNGWPLDCFDFDSAFLNSELADDEVIYLEQPRGYQQGDGKKYVFRLHKALYGLKQDVKNWYDALRHQ